MTTTETSPTPPSSTSGLRMTPTDLALIAAFAALIVACALLPAINVGGGIVPITLQTFGVMTAGAVLGAKRGFLAVLLYLALGAIGLPVFTGGTGGLGRFSGPSAGYLIAFPFAAALCGLLVERLPRDKVATSLALVFAAGMAGSIVFTHPFGIAGLHWRAGMTWSAAFNTDKTFWIGDVVKNLLMASVATAVHRAFPDLLGRRR